MGNTPYTEKKSRFLLTKLEESLEATIRDREKIQAKAIWVLSVIGAALVLIVGAFIDGADQIEGAKDYLLILASMLATVAMLITDRCIMPSRYASKGTEPKRLKQEFLEQNIELMIAGYMENLQGPINFNRKQIKQLTADLRNLTLALISTPFLAGLIKTLLITVCTVC